MTRIKRIIVAIDQARALKSFAWMAAATYEPIPGKVYCRFRTLIASLAARKNQPPPKLIIPFHTRPITEAGSSKRVNRSHLDRRYRVAISSSSRGTDRRD